MNDKDKEAFEKWWKETMPNPDWLSSDHASDVYKAWQNACKYKQKEIDELKIEVEQWKAAAMAESGVNEELEKKYSKGSA